tara:strand:- start:186 stop:389 length:204 start_codon:yes stop_codon:yes gene_type:complete
MSRHPYYAKYDYSDDGYNDEEEEGYESGVGLWILQKALELQNARNELARKQRDDQDSTTTDTPLSDV